MPKRIVFIVDDEVILGKMLVEMLEDEGYETVFYDDPQKVLAEEVKPDLLITDYRMPVVDGLTLIRRCRSAWPGVKTLMISGNCFSMNLSSLCERPDVFIQKPFLVSEVVNATKELLAEGEQAEGKYSVGQ